MYIIDSRKNMSEKLIEDLFQHFKQKENSTPEEANFTRQLEKEIEIYPVCNISKQELENMGLIPPNLMMVI